MLSKISKILIVMSLAILPVLALAQAPSTDSRDNKIVCVGTAVKIREAALGSALLSNTQAIQAAYSARALALEQAYANSTNSAVKSAIKEAWSAFRNSMKIAAKNWKLAKNATWSQFKHEVKACKADVNIKDTSHSGWDAVIQ